jgi:hypothetical protein
MSSAPLHQNYGDCLPGSGKDESITERNRLRSDIYEIASDPQLVYAFEAPFWWGATEQMAFHRFMGNQDPDAPNMGIIRVQLNESTEEALRVSVAQIFTHHDPRLRNREQQHVLFVHPNFKFANIDPSKVRVEPQDTWSFLVKDLAAKLCPLTKDSTKVSDTDDANGDADRCLEAIEAVQELTSPSDPIKHFCFIAGLDRAYYTDPNFNRTWGEILERERRRLAARQAGGSEGARPVEISPEQVADDERREKIKRLVRALERLFTRDKGKVVFFIDSNFPEFEGLVKDKNSIKLIIQAPALAWSSADTRLPDWCQSGAEIEES